VISAHLDDQASFDKAARRLAPGGVLAELLQGVPPETAERITQSLPKRGGRLNVGQMSSQGRPGLWFATRWSIDELKRAQRWVPTPAHERWDALLDLHRTEPEAAWLVAEVFASLDGARGALGRRILLGVERRFGARGGAILSHVAASAPLAELLTPMN